MNPNQTRQAEQLKSGNAFTVINNVRDHCQQPDVKRWLLLILATYCDRKGICWPSNRKLMRVTGKSERTIQRMLKELEAVGELKVLSSGAGHKQKRILSLSRYAKPVIAMTPLNPTRSLGEMSLNIHSEHPVHFSKEKSTHHLLRKVVRFPFFEGEELVLEEAANAVHFYNKKLRRHGWQAVRKLSPAVEQVLDIFEPETIIELVEGVLAGSPDVSVPERRTLVRLCWDNY